MEFATFYIEQDNSITCEFIHDQFRIGFCLDPEPGESSWYVVSKLEGVEGACEHFDPNNLGEMLAKVYEFYTGTATTWDEVADKVLKENHNLWEKLSKV